MVDYRKFDAIDTDSEDEEVPTISPAAGDANQGGTKETMTKKGKEGRVKFEHEGRTIYEWDQSLTEVNIYLEPPPDVPRKMLEVVISHRHLLVGIKGTPAFIDEDLGGPCIPGDSLWTISDGELNINLQKMNKAEAWDCALSGAGSRLDSFTKEETKKKLMLERFQEEHPSFDFSGADFNGQVPDAREFMGGVNHF